MAPHKKYKIIIRKNISLKKKGEEKDTIPRMEAQMPRTTGAVLKVKMKRKND
jgi:hypothetical protein